MQPDQFRQLCKWLAVSKFAGSPKFVMTASALLPRRRTVSEQQASALASDAWEGYPFSLHSLLAHICENQIKGVVFLSGDEHVSSVTSARVTALKTGAQCTLHSIHSSGLFSPYPFGDGSPDEFMTNDSFDFKVGTTRLEYRCDAKTTFFPGDGFALATAHNNTSPRCSLNNISPSWSLNVKFYNSAGMKPHGEENFDLI